MKRRLQCQCRKWSDGECLLCYVLLGTVYIARYSATFLRHLYFVEWPLKAFRCTMFME